MKRVFDFFSALVGLVILSPVFIIVYILVKVKLGSPAIFRQERPGMGETPFWLYKFRTMTDARDSSGVLLPDGERLTKFGRFLRKSSLDEIPELLNVLKGDMSLVGPRPLLMRYLPFYTPAERVRFSVKPGITGWAQINGRNESSWDTRLKNDIWYVENKDFLLDLRILVKTILKVFRAEGVVVDAKTLMRNLDEERGGTIDG